MAIWTLELQADTGSGVTTFYAATATFNTDGADLPAHQHFHPSLQVPANFERALFNSGATTGGSTIGYGEIVLANAHGRYDSWPDYAFDGRSCIVKAIVVDETTQKPLWSYKDTPALIRGTVESVDITDAFKRIRLRLYDRLSDLDRPLLTERYAGTTTSGGLGVEGTEDLRDTLKPAVYGQVLNMQPVDVNPFDLIRQVSARACAAITVYDGGLALALGGDFPTAAALASASLTLGDYATCLALGLFRLGGAPISTITADVTASGTGTAAGIVLQMLHDAGFGVGDLDESTFQALAAKNPAPCGILVSGDTSVLQAVVDVLRSVGGWIVPNGLGLFQVGRLELPSAAPIAAIAEWQIRGDLERLTPGDSNRGIPCHQVVVRYGRLEHTATESEIAGAVTPERRSFLQVAVREARASAPTVKSRFLSSPEMVFETRMIAAADAQAEAERLLSIYRVRRDVWRVRVDMTGVDYRANRSDGTPFGLPIALGSTVSLSASRFLNPPRNFVVIGRVEDCVQNRIQFDLWG